jgi:spore maturation protein CgeB
MEGLMKFALFCHSIISDWNHGNAHFLRGICTELMLSGHEVRVLEPEDAWSARNLVRDHGPNAIAGFRAAYPRIESYRYGADLDLAAELDGVDVTIVHEWTPPKLVKQIGQHLARRKRGVLLFHDTHHRAATAPEEIEQFDLSHYDAVLAFGEVIRQRYLERGWAGQAFTWHEAADTRTFFPRTPAADRKDIVWVGNWGDDERSEELREYLIGPIAALGLNARVHGVRYPEQALQELQANGIEYGGFLPNYLVPDAFAAARMTLHVPRRPYATALPGIPTIRVFEALACGIPLVSSPWDDAEQLFHPGEDYLIARDGREMRQLIRDVLHDPTLAQRLSHSGMRTILARHTCRHRVNELLEICRKLGAPAAEPRIEERATP